MFYDYNAVGVASFYGKECHGKPMANGEKFNRLAMTAAHRTLPLPSVVMVTSLITGKSIVVVITDRGPFHYWDRTIDLSEGASKALGIGNFKPSQVRIKTLVADSLALSTYISRYCRKGRDQFGRSWEQVYFQEIAGRKIHAYKGSRG
ncbi:hypothetical protein FACS1894113_1710 [Alphaproteobacteria bacterium]|nr:hypothetical protein FACS1894113_1710 [Alphaproteobacteria bacterium]